MSTERKGGQHDQGTPGRLRQLIPLTHLNGFLVDTSQVDERQDYKDQKKKKFKKKLQEINLLGSLGCQKDTIHLWGILHLA